LPRGPPHHGLVALAGSLVSAHRRCGPAGRPRHAGKAAKGTVQLFHGEYDLANRILVAGCDPGISVLARHVLRAGVELVVAQRNSSQALALLKQGLVHVAGTHLRDEASGESNLPAIHRLFARK
jgi:hypothetical protein